jgi:hypothetical protein
MLPAHRCNTKEAQNWASKFFKREEHATKWQEYITQERQIPQRHKQEEAPAWWRPLAAGKIALWESVDLLESQPESDA